MMRALWCAAFATALCSGCGLILEGRTTQIHVSSEPPGATIAVQGQNLTTPGSATVSKLPYVVVRSDDIRYDDACAVAEFDKNNWLMFLDSVPAALGLLVDRVANTFPGNYPPVHLVLTPIEAGSEGRMLPPDTEILANRFLCNHPSRLPPLQKWIAQYDLAMVSVDRPGVRAERYGPVVRVGSIKRERDLAQFGYKDQSLRLTIVPTDEAIEFEIENRTEHSEKLVWDDAAFVDFDGTSHRLTHSGVRYLDRNTSLPPSVIAAHRFLKDVAVPVNRIEQTNLEFRHLPLVPQSRRSCAETEDAFEKRAYDPIGASISFLLPIEIGGVVNEYTLTLKVESLQFGKARSCTELPSFSGDRSIEREPW